MVRYGMSYSEMQGCFQNIEQALADMKELCGKNQEAFLECRMAILEDLREIERVIMATKDF